MCRTLHTRDARPEGIKRDSPRGLTVAMHEGMTPLVQGLIVGVIVNAIVFALAIVTTHSRAR